MARPLSFDPDQKLHEAMLHFWQNGYSETKVDTLTEQLGLNRFSLYKQFGNKAEVFEQALNHYNQKIFRRMLEPLTQHKGKDAIIAYFENFERQVSQAQNGAGCLINNTLLEGEAIPRQSMESARGMVNQLRSLLKSRFEEAAQMGELQLKPLDCLNFTLMTIQALLNTRKHLGPLAMKHNLRFYRDRLSEW